MTPKRDSGWRDTAAAGLLVKHLRRLALSGHALVMEDPCRDVPEALEAAGLEVQRWWRRAFEGRPASAWPPTGPFDVVALRLPRAKEELAMAVQGAAAALAPNALLLVYGAKDEGAGSAAPLLEEVFDDVRTFATGGHCRVLIATTPRTGQPRKAGLDSWRSESPLDFPGGSAAWVSYPGVFAGGRLDSGTAMLLRNLPALRPGARVLDFGCGSGVIGAAAGASGGNLRVDCLDVDAVALEAARENVPHAHLILADGLSAVGDVRYHAILSNPPYHRGKAETLAAVDALIAGAGRVLVPGGHLVFVVQRRLPVEPLLKAAFPHVRALDGDGTFGVWDASTSPPRHRRPRS